MSTGILETISGQLKELNENLIAALQSDPGIPIPATPSDPESAGKPQSKKKVSAKKVASKKVASKGKPKKDDLSDLTVFKKRLFEVAEEQGVSDPLAALKAYFKASSAADGPGSSDEVDADDRQEFLDELAEHFRSESGDGESDELDY